jgi:hypothetical protein
MDLVTEGGRDAVPRSRASRSFPKLLTLLFFANSTTVERLGVHRTSTLAAKPESEPREHSPFGLATARPDEWLGLQEDQQVTVDRLGLGGWHAVRESFVGL